MSTRRAYRPAPAPHHYYGPDGFCRVNGGTVSPLRCGRCNRDHAQAYEIALKRLDRQANRGR